MIRRAEQARGHQANAEASDNDAMNELSEHLANAMAGNVGSSQTPQEPETEGMDASDIKASASTYYGTKVNYNNEEGQAKAGQEWEIFLADETNIYLITKDSLRDPVYDASDLSGAVSATTYANGSSMLIAEGTKSYFPAVEKWFNWPITDEFASINDNMKATLFMLDSINVWNGTYHTEGITEWAIGAPTQEMLCESVNDVEKTEYVATPTSATGYNITMTSQFLYDSCVWAEGASYWIAAPSAYSTSYVLTMVLDDTQYVVNSIKSYDSYTGFRPVVCLSSGVTLEAVEEDGVVTEFNILGAQ